MNKKGFTLVELIATLVVLGIVMGITIVSVSGIFGSAKEKTEDVFVDTIKDALDIYLATDAKKINDWTTCGNRLDKSYKTDVVVRYRFIHMSDVIASGALTEKDFVNPANEDVECAMPDITIYKDEDHVYYYQVNKSNFLCLKGTGQITNLPIIVDESGNERYYSCH